MSRRSSERKTARKPILSARMGVAAFKGYYWFKADLLAFARRLGLPTHGYKPELSARIERRLRGLPDGASPRQPRATDARDSDQPLRRATPVISYRSDARTRAFFVAQIGPEFHFTYHVNQFRLHNRGLTYGDLIDEWLRERDRRRRADYEVPIAEHGKYNRFIRDFFADRANQGKSLREAAAAWNEIKHEKGNPRYRAR